MKNNIVHQRHSRGLRHLLGVALLAAGLAAPVSPAVAADPHLSMKGGEHLLYLNSREQADKLKKGDQVAMVCSMCKSVAVVRVERERGREFLKPGTKHGCAGCGATVEVIGQRMDKKETVRHVCSKCGEHSAFCCATPQSDEKGGHKH